MIDGYVGLIVTGLCTGLGSAFGNYLSTRVLIKNIERLEYGINKNKQDSSKTLHEGNR